MRELEKVYDPKAVEDQIYKFWMDGEYFKAEADENKKPFTIVIPPPNVTGQLHMGHALDNTLQDILIRFKRMQGYVALWIPGTDHAGIATQIKVEEMLRKEQGKSRHDYGRDAFLEIVWDWKEKYGGRIIEQLKKLGASCDWSRLRFTMDDGCSEAVKEVFVRLYEKGLIYRGNRIINWCPKCVTALSDAEVEYIEKDGNLWHIKYPYADGSGYLTVATTRPETMLGDTAIAVAPDDEKYTAMVGKTVIVPLIGREIPVIADEYVDKSFGTGCVKITPCHDPNDFEVGKRNGLEQILIMDDQARINANGGKYEGMERYEARKAILADLEEKGLLEKTETHVHNVGHCYRCSSAVEPIASLQWFVSMKPLAEPAKKAVEDDEIKFVPERFSKTYTNWMDNVRDWCISRQLWWGHRIPAYYCEDCGHMEVSKTDIKSCPKCNSSNVSQDNDVLDTWFSSALWPFSTLGWPKETEDFKYFYPTSVLVTGYDIIFFWVARMIFSGLEYTGKRPFEHVLIHGLVRDAQGRKMSKSLGNGIDPLEVIENYGADALRFTLATGNSPGNDMRFSYERVEASRNFANKLWNAARFMMMNLKIESIKLPDITKCAIEDKWILSRYNALVNEVTDTLESFEPGMAVQKLYDFIWDNLCDWYIELVKPRLFNDEDKESNLAAQQTISYVFNGVLKLLHPFMPFITEEIYRTMPNEDSIMVSEWPKYNESLNLQSDEEAMSKIMSAIKAIRNRRAEMNVPPSKKATVYIETQSDDIFSAGKVFFERLASASNVEINKDIDSTNAVIIIADGAKIILPMNELVDFEKEKERLEKEKKKLLAEIIRAESKLNNPGFVSKAPESLIVEEKAKLEKHKAMITELENAINSLK